MCHRPVQCSPMTDLKQGHDFPVNKVGPVSPQGFAVLQWLLLPSQTHLLSMSWGHCLGWKTKRLTMHHSYRISPRTKTPSPAVLLSSSRNQSTLSSLVPKAFNPYIWPNSVLCFPKQPSGFFLKLLEILLPKNKTKPRNPPQLLNPKFLTRSHSWFFQVLCQASNS